MFFACLRKIEFCKKYEISRKSLRKFKETTTYIIQIRLDHFNYLSIYLSLLGAAIIGYLPSKILELSGREDVDLYDEYDTLGYRFSSYPC